MIFASGSRNCPRAWLAAVVLGIGAIALTAPAEARMGGFGGGGFGGFYGGMGGFGASAVAAWAG